MRGLGMSEENVSLVRGLYDAFNRRDFDAAKYNEVIAV
jgi:hypothetical protein